MNAIIALCHFCEMHGPKVVFCTEAFHSEEPAHLVLNGNVSGITCADGAEFGKPTFYGNVSNWSKSVTSTVSSTSVTQSTSYTDTCEACRSLTHNGPGFISNDDEARVSYVSSQHPHKPGLFSIVRQACVRSLSCEVCPGREGPIFFGDEQREQVFSYTFYLKDSRARGFQRWYSIIVIMMDKMFLLNSWPFLVRHCRHMISELQAKATEVYDTEQCECPQRAVRLKHVSGIEPRNFRRHRSGGSDQARSLVALTKDELIFKHIHIWFTWILRAGGNRMREKLLEGPRRMEDVAVIDMEMQEETEEGFVNVMTKPVSECDKGDDDIDVVESDVGDVDDSSNKFTSIRHVLMVLEYDKFHILAYNTIIGSQIVVRSRNQSLVKSLLHQLACLIPHGCCKLVSYSREYLGGSNLLGLHEDVMLPPSTAAADCTLMSKPHVLVDISRVELESMSGTEAPPDNGSINSRYQFTVTPVNLPPHHYNSSPSLLKYLERKVAEPKLTNEVLEHVFVAAKEKWMNKVKVLYKYCQSGNHSRSDVNRLVHTLSEDGGDEDGKVLKFWITGITSYYRNYWNTGSTHTEAHTLQAAVPTPIPATYTIN